MKKKTASTTTHHQPSALKKKYEVSKKPISGGYLIAKKLFLEERYKTGREIKSAHDRELSKECFRARGINFYLFLPNGFI